jgi:hypothetical protein
LFSAWLNFVANCLIDFGWKLITFFFIADEPTSTLPALYAAAVRSFWSLDQKEKNTL